MPILTINGKALKSSSEKILYAPPQYLITIKCDYVDAGVTVDDLMAVYQCAETSPDSNIPNEQWVEVPRYVHPAKVLRATGPTESGSVHYLISKPFILVALSKIAKDAGLTEIHTYDAGQACDPWKGPIAPSNRGVIYRIPQYNAAGDLLDISVEIPF